MVVLFICFFKKGVMIMDHAFTVTPQDVFNIIVVVSGAIVTISAALAVIVKAVGKAKEPNKVQDERISTLEEQVQSINARLQLGNKRFESDSGRVDSIESNMKASNKVIIESLQALTSHAIDGNNIDELKDAKKGLDEYLINKM